MRKGLFLAILMIFLVSGCASVKVTKTNDGKYEEGVRFYRSEPYLWVTSEKDNQGKESWKCQMIYLPNKKQEYVVNVSGGMGTVDAKLTLENGWNLTQFGDARDSKVPETINAVANLVGAVGKSAVLFSKEEGKALFPKGVGLYRLVFDEPDQALDLDDKNIIK